DHQEVLRNRTLPREQRVVRLVEVEAFIDIERPRRLATHGDDSAHGLQREGELVDASEAIVGSDRVVDARRRLRDRGVDPESLKVDNQDSRQVVIAARRHVSHTEALSWVVEDLADWRIDGHPGIEDTERERFKVDDLTANVAGDLK